MRIIGYIQDNEMKITLLEMNHRVSVKFEMDMMEQTYKLRQDPSPEFLKSLDQMIKGPLRVEVIQKFKEMKELYQQLTVNSTSNNPPSFPEII